MAFAAEVAKHFDFLVRDHGFAQVAQTGPAVGERVTYRKQPLDFSIGWYKGEIGLDFSVALEFAAHHRVFRPYLSRTFSLYEIASRQDASAYAEFAVRMKPLGFVTNLEIASACLEETAKIVKRHCEPILDGDFSALEAITLARQRK